MLRSLWRAVFGRPRHRDVLAQACAPANLAMAYAKVRRRAQQSPAGQRDILKFGEANGPQLDQLRRALLRGRYQPGRIRRFNLPKIGGGKRPVVALTLADRIAQTALAQTLTPLLDPELHPRSFAFRPNRSLADALDAIEALRRDGFVWVVDADVERFFESIRHRRVLDRLRQSVADRSACKLVEVWLRHHAAKGIGIPQGSPLSPLLANLALDAVDHAVEKRGGHLVRYADDILVLCRKRRDAEKAARVLADTLRAEGLSLSATKTEITNFERGFFFLGHFMVRDLVLRDAASQPCTDVQKRLTQHRERGILARWWRRLV